MLRPASSGARCTTSATPRRNGRPPPKERTEGGSRGRKPAARLPTAGRIEMIKRGSRKRRRNTTAREAEQGAIPQAAPNSRPRRRREHPERRPGSERRAPKPATEASPPRGSIVAGAWPSESRAPPGNRERIARTRQRRRQDKRERLTAEQTVPARYQTGPAVRTECSHAGPEAPGTLVPDEATHI